MTGDNACLPPENPFFRKFEKNQFTLQPVVHKDGETMITDWHNEYKLPPQDNWWLWLVVIGLVLLLVVLWVWYNMKATK